MIEVGQCSFCKGSGQAERREVLWSKEWIRGSLADDMDIPRNDDGTQGDAERWVDCDCPSCDGKGSVELEFPRCRIY